MIHATTEELAYCAGIIDADGTVGIKRMTYAMRVTKDCEQPTYSERVCVREVEPQAVELLRRIFGGSFGIAKAYAERGKPLFAWAVTDRKAARCLEAVLPYLRIKRAQAENCLALRRIKEVSKRARVAVGRGHAGAARRPVEIGCEMERLHVRAHELNAVGRRVG